MTLADFLQQCLAEHTGCVAAGLLDLQAARMLEFYTHVTDHQPMMLVGALAAELFETHNAAVLSLQRVCAADGQQPKDVPQELMVKVVPWLHIMLRCPGRNDRGLLLSFEQDVNVGVALTEARAAVKVLERTVL